MKSKNRLFEIWEAYQSEGGSSESLWQYLVSKHPYVFAHHPEGEQFAQHVWKWRGLYWCKGCVMTFAGLLLGFVLQLGFGWLQRFEIGVLALVFVLMLLPTLVTSLLGAARWIKHIARMLLGILCSSSLCLFFVTDAWWVRVVLILTFFAVKLPLEKKRDRDNLALLNATGSCRVKTKVVVKGASRCCR